MFNLKRLSVTILFLFYLTGCCSKKAAVQFSSSIEDRQDSNKIVIIGDTQKTSFWEFWRERNTNIQDSIFKKIAEENPAFVIHLGDLVFQGDDVCHWKDFEKSAAVLKDKNIPILPILGNHEYYGNNKTALENYFWHFPELNQKTYYYQKFKKIGVIFLNSNFNDMDTDQFQQQNIWLRDLLISIEDDTTIKIVLMVMHHSPYTNSKVVEASEKVQQHFVDPYKNLTKPRIYFSGHCHSYEHFEMGGTHFIVSGGGGGPRHLLKTDDADYLDLYTEQMGEKRDFSYCVISVLENRLKIEMQRMNKQFKWQNGEMFFVDF